MELPGEFLPRSEETVKLRQEKIEMDRAGHHRILLRNAVAGDAVPGGGSPADVGTFGSVLIQIVEIAFLLLPAEDFLPVEVHDLVQFSHVVIDEGVQRFVVIHGRGHNDLRLLPEEVFQFFPVHQLEQLDRIPPPAEFRHQQCVAVEFPDDMLI